MIALAWRFARAVLTVIAVAAAAWCLVELGPGRTEERAARAAGLLPVDTSSMSRPQIDAIVAPVARAHRLDRPLLERIAGYVVRVFVLDFGASWRDGNSVGSRLGGATAASAVLVGTALALALALGMGLGVVCAVRPGKTLDVALSALAAMAFAIPPAWLGMLALRAVPGGSGVGPLAAVTLAIVPAFVLARHARAALVDGSRQPWAIAALARGATRWRVVAVHALAASASPLVSMFPALVAYALGASLVVEQVFGIRGLGWLIADGSARGDAPIVVGGSVVAAGIMSLASAIADSAARSVDPRIAPEDRAGPRIAPEDRAGPRIAPEDRAGPRIAPEDRAGPRIAPEDRARA
jgi:ABC-type dipeptide/oligopeptide/nickel transport system permease component